MPIFILATCWCRAYPVLQEPVYVLLRQPVSSPDHDLASAVSTHSFQDTSPEQEAADGEFSSPLSTQDLLEGGVLVPDSPLVIDALTVEDSDVGGDAVLPRLDAVTVVVEEETPVVNEAFPILETLTVMKDYPVINDGLLVAVTLTFLEDGTQAVKVASLVDSSIVTRQETPDVEAVSPMINAVAVGDPLDNVPLKKLPAQTEKLSTGRSGTPAIEDASPSVDSAPLVMATGPVADPVRAVKTVSPVAEPGPVAKVTDPVIDSVPAAKTTSLVVKPVRVSETTTHVHPVPVVKATDPVVDARAVVKATDPVADAIPVVKAADPVVDALSVVQATDPVVAPVPVAKAVAPVAAASPAVVAAAAPEPLLAPGPPMPSAATPFIGGQFHAQDEAGQYSFGHWGGPNTRVEIQDSMGRTSGSFAYVDPEGDVQIRKYAAAPGSGFRVAASDLPTDTPTAAHARAATEDLVGRPVVSKA
ncbi:uncharacterized protein [Panulirus ornatus]|uniref:uncharacterized protein isoform X2 n=1 Tax=Panulirus ornatus TaxID=150431 RepID=UPI003A8912CC